MSEDLPPFEFTNIDWIYLYVGRGPGTDAGAALARRYQISKGQVQ